MEQTIFDKTIKMLEETEQKLLSQIKIEKTEKNLFEKIFYKIFSFLKRFFLLKIETLDKGFHFLSSDFRTIAILFIIIYVFFLYVLKINIDVFVNIFPLILFTIVYFTIFKIPSSFSTSNVKDKDIVTVLKIFKSYNLTKNEYNVVKNIFVEFKENVKKRILAFRSIIVFIWTVFYYIFDKFILAKFQNESMESYDITYIIVYVFVIFMAYIMIESYNKGVWYIMRSFEFALIEYENHFETNDFYKPYNQEKLKEPINNNEKIVKNIDDLE